MKAINKKQLKSHKSPLISVLMTVYNGEKFIADSINSILNQTYKYFELLIIDDASTDNTSLVLCNFLSIDRRIRVLKNEMNLGLTKSLNIGIKEAKGKYIARIDADDISLPNRLSVQLEFMEKHQDVILCGAFVEVFQDENVKDIWKFYVFDKEISCELLFNSLPPHSTFFFRRKGEDGLIFYDENYKRTQDYELVSRLNVNYKVAIIPEVLVRYRVHSGQITLNNNNEQLFFANKVRKRNVLRLIDELSEEELHIHCSISTNKFKVIDFNCFKAVNSWLYRLYRENITTQEFDVQAFRDVLSRHWSLSVDNMFKLGTKGGFFFLFADMTKVSNLSFRDKFYILRQFIKVALKNNFIYKVFNIQ